jgi:hypothetical protein
MVHTAEIWTMELCYVLHGYLGYCFQMTFRLIVMYIPILFATTLQCLHLLLFWKQDCSFLCKESCWSSPSVTIFSHIIYLFAVIDLSRSSSNKCSIMSWPHYMPLSCSPSNTMSMAYVNDSRYYDPIVGAVCGTLSFLIFLASCPNSLSYCYLFIYFHSRYCWSEDAPYQSGRKHSLCCWQHTKSLWS